MLKMITCIGLLCMLMFACGGESDATRAVVTASTSDALKSNETPAACERLKDFARTCYDHSDPSVACVDVYVQTVELARVADLRPSTQKVFADLCTAACVDRKNGQAWSDIAEDVDCSKTQSQR